MWVSYFTWVSWWGLWFADPQMGAQRAHLHHGTFSFVKKLMYPIGLGCTDNKKLSLQPRKSKGDDLKITKHDVKAFLRERLEWQLASWSHDGPGPWRQPLNPRIWTANNVTSGIWGPDNPSRCSLPGCMIWNGCNINKLSCFDNRLPINTFRRPWEPTHHPQAPGTYIHP